MPVHDELRRGLTWQHHASDYFPQLHETITSLNSKMTDYWRPELDPAASTPRDTSWVETGNYSQVCSCGDSNPPKPILPVLIKVQWVGMCLFSCCQSIVHFQQGDNNEEVTRLSLLFHSSLKPALATKRRHTATNLFPASLIMVLIITSYCFSPFKIFS